MNYYIIYSLTYPLGASLYFERIRGRPYCLRGGHGSFKITVISTNVAWSDKLVDRP